jgi:hypothetical protein
MGNCDCYNGHALRCRPRQKAWVWRRAYFIALFRYFTLNTWSATYLYLQKRKGEQKEFLQEFRDSLIEGRRNKLQKEKEAKQKKRKQKNANTTKEVTRKRKPSKRQSIFAKSPRHHGSQTNLWCN